MKTEIYYVYKNVLIGDSNVPHVCKLRMRVPSNGLHLHRLAPPSKEKKAARYAMHNDIERVTRMDVAHKTICTKAAGERDPRVVIREAR